MVNLWGPLTVILKHAGKCLKCLEKLVVWGGWGSVLEI